MAVHIGTSGWSYNHWVDVLYPRKASSLERLDAYTRVFKTVEVNNTFYRWPHDEVFKTWYNRMPPGFLATIKASRFLTHFRKLRDPVPVLNQMQQGLELLQDKRGVLLVQLPPWMSRDRERLAEFLAVLPTVLPRGQRVAIEFRHASWEVSETFALLERYNAAYCIMNGANLSCLICETADFVYVRLHGPDQQRLYSGSYSDADLWWWAERIGEWSAQGRDVFAYFNNDGHGYAVRNALRLCELVGC